jgi:hypothetical protein
MESATPTFNCPHCGQQTSGRPSHGGAEVKCQACGQIFTAPVAARAADGASNPLLVPLVAVAALLLVALGVGGFLWIDHGNRQTPSLDVPTSNPAATAPAKTAEHNSFEEVAAHLDRGGSFYLYMDTAQWLAGLSQQIDSFRDIALSTLGNTQDAATADSAKLGFGIVSDLVKKSGLEEISGVGASSIAVDQGIYVNKVFVHHQSGKGNGFMWSAFGKAPHHLDALDFLPADTALANSSDLDLGNVLEGLREELALTGIPNAGQALDASLAQFSATLGMPVDDLLKSLGGSLGLVLTLNPAKVVSVPVEGQALSVPTPRLAIFLRVKDDRLFTQIDRMLGAIPTVIRHDEPDLRMRGVPVPGPAEAWFHPTVAQWSQGYLLIASDETIIRDMVAAQKTGQGLKATPQFTSLFAGLPQEGNAFQIVTPQFGETWAVLQREILKSSQSGTTPEQMALMRKLFSQQTPGAVCSVSTHLGDGWLVVGKGTQGASPMFGPLLIAPAAIAAGVALPVFGQVQEKGKATKSLSQAKQIALACKLYAVDNNGKFPPALQALVPDYLLDTSIFVSPFRLDARVGYDYTSGLTDTSPASTILLEDKFSPEVGHVRVVCHVDGSAEMIKVPPASVP